jgi:hypothetical protein
MVGWIVRHLAALTTTLLSTAVLLAANLGAAGNTLPPTRFSLTAQLIVAPDLPPMAQRVLLSEAERIWRREGVQLHWPTSPSQPTPASLRVLVITRREALNSGRERWPVGELVPQTGQRALAIASIAGAERVLLEATGYRPALLESHELTDYRLGLVLGRAVAHEIGHYLLATSTHADRGLMRASIDAREFADPGATTFTLDDDAGHWVRERLVDAESTTAPLPSTGFSYARANDATPAPTR